MITILHGALGSEHQFEALQSQLGEPSRVVSFVGHGNTPDVDSPWSIELFSTQLEQFLANQSDSSPARIFGYSMGGYVALHCALRSPHLFERILTLGTKFAWSQQVARKEAERLNPDMILAKVPAFAVDLERRHGTENWKNVLAKTAEMMIGLGVTPALEPHMLGSLQPRVRYGVGDRDTMVSVEETLEYYRATPNAELSVLPSTPHPIERVDPLALSGYVLEFLS